MGVANFADTWGFLIRYLLYKIEILQIIEITRLFLTLHYSFPLKNT